MIPRRLTDVEPEHFPWKREAVTPTATSFSLSPPPFPLCHGETPALPGRLETSLKLVP